MAVRIGHASLSENGTINGKKGDSTKKEVCIRNWYSKPWDFMAIHPDSVVRELHALSVESACANDNIGYGQADRNTLNDQAKLVKYDISKISKKCNCDCSSLQNVCAVASGAKGVSYDSNGWTTRNMKAKLKAAGYAIIEDEAYLSSSMYCVRGVIYVKEGKHTVCGLDNGSKYKKTLEKVGLYTSKSSDRSGSIINKVTAKGTANEFDKSLTGSYVTTANLHMRDNVGSDSKSLVVIPKGTIVNCYGYYGLSKGVKWLYIQFILNGVQYTGFSSKAYLKK